MLISVTTMDCRRLRRQIKIQAKQDNPWHAVAEAGKRWLS